MNTDQNKNPGGTSTPEAQSGSIYRGWTIRTDGEGGFVAQLIGSQGGQCLERCPTAEEAKALVDALLQAQIDREIAWKAGEAEREVARKAAEEARIKQAAEEAEKKRKHTEAVLACLPPIRQFAATHGLQMLEDCADQLRKEEAEAKTATEADVKRIADEDTCRELMYDAYNTVCEAVGKALKRLDSDDEQLSWWLAEYCEQITGWVNGTSGSWYTLESSVEYNYPDLQSNFLDEFGSPEEEEEA
jgi:hypothetical protein